MMNDIGLLIARVTVGASIAAHGAQKAWGTFDGPGPQGAAGFMESLGFVPGSLFATAASTAEIASGALLALGAGGPLGPATLISTMVVAQTSVHAKNGYFSQKGGIELGVMYSAAALALAAAGYGRFSIDEAFEWDDALRRSWVTGIALGGGVLAGLAMLSRRSSQESAPAGLDTASAKENAPNTAQTAAPLAASAAGASGELATIGTTLDAAAENRPVPADLLVASDGNAAPSQ